MQHSWIMFMLLEACAYGSQRFISESADEQVYVSCKYKSECLVTAGDECPSGYQTLEPMTLRDDNKRGFETIIKCISNKNMVLEFTGN